MKRLILVPLLLAGAILPARAAESTERITVGDKAHVVVAVPDKWTLTRSVNGGYPSLRLESPDRAVILQVSLFPDDNGLMADEELQLVMLGDLVAPFLADSVEKTAQLRPLNPRRGGGRYCVFTDARLVGVKELPPNEYRHATAGLKTGRGWFGVFTLLSQDTVSAEYRTSLDVLRNSLHADTPDTTKPRRNPHAF